MLRPGLAVSELAVSPLPGAPTAVFTLRAAPGDETDGLIVVSFSNATLVFEIGEEVKETSSSGFLATVATLHTQLMEDGSMLQVWRLSWRPRAAPAVLLCCMQGGGCMCDVCD